METITLLKSKIHRATVTEADVHYVGSLTLDPVLIEAAGLVPFERVEVADVDNGERLATYVIAGERGSGTVCMNGAAALKIGVGDRIIIFAYAQVAPAAAPDHRPQLVFVDDANAITQVQDAIVAGQRIDA